MGYEIVKRYKDLWENTQVTPKPITLTKKDWMDPPFNLSTLFLKKITLKSKYSFFKKNYAKINERVSAKISFWPTCWFFLKYCYIEF
jgi:hypothetical protein